MPSNDGTPEESFLCANGNFEFGIDQFCRGHDVLEGSVKDWIAVVLDHVRFSLGIGCSSREQIQLHVRVGDVGRVLQRDVGDFVNDD